MIKIVIYKTIEFEPKQSLEEFIMSNRFDPSEFKDYEQPYVDAYLHPKKVKNEDSDNRTSSTQTRKRL